MKTGLHSGFAAVVLGLALAGCNYDAPLTSVPTHPIDEQLLGEWIQPEEHDWMTVRALDADHYVIAYGRERPGEQPDLYRAFHTDFGGHAFVSVQNLQPGSDHLRYVYLTWVLSPDGTHLTMRTINTKLVPESKGSTAEQQAIVTAHAQDPALLNEEMVFVRPTKK